MGFLDFLKKRLAPPVAARRPLASRPETAQVSSHSEMITRPSPETIVAELEAAGYFKYDEAADLPSLKKEIGQEISASGDYPLVENSEGRSRILDIRMYSLDNEDLFELGGMKDALKHMQRFFTKIGVRIELTAEEEGVSEDNLSVNHWIALNGKRYDLFVHFTEPGWGEAAQRFADMINDQLAIQQSPERLYLINGGNDGRAVFLTSELATVIRRYVTDREWAPLETKEWCEVVKVTYQSVIPEE